MAKKEKKHSDPFEGIIDEQDEKLHVPKELPILMLRDIVVFPYMVVPLFVGREKSKNAIDFSLSTHRMILLLTQKSAEAEDPKREDVYEIGTVALVMRMLKLPDGRVRILAQGVMRAKIENLEENKPYYSARVKVIHELEEQAKSIEVEALIRNVRDGLDRASALGKNIPPEIMIIAANVEDPGRLADLTVANLDLKVK
ncbi:MAG: LON peptidase substrate-binding domain-containing protein, partial [Candidatus Aminicenantes bacterium]|nr:LON peptidase substrate-binding domain-containing protein [Candidatus Aminicenantes bacterium]